jgi:tetratricopeptide (TPR) repeat protein
MNRKFNAICYSNRGLAYMRMRKHELAISDFNKSIELDSRYAKSYVRKAEAL